MMLSALVHTYPYKRSSGFERLRDRIHRKRHRHQKPSVMNETDELYEMSMTVPKADEDDDFAFRNRREKNEELCQNQRKIVELNTQSHEFDPPFVVEVRCLNTLSSNGNVFSGQEQTCFKGMLRCVQQYADVHVSRRSVGSIHWHPYTISDVPVSCQCMWPVDRYGHQEF
ncbi:hypothetical protein B9Z55_010613 [Caenorhabditis nigoni]|nr:hypothetical protein B9Z55_010613 [Caenorhabditis nigoni]